MARIFITGSTDGLGQLAAKALIDLGHQVVLHARNSERGRQALAKVPGAEDVLIADLFSIDATKALASKANASGTFDVIIHNAGVYEVSTSAYSDGLPLVFAVNSLAPYILTCLMNKPKRQIYLSSDMHLQGNPNLDNILLGRHKSGVPITYCDTKLHDVILCMAVARKLRDVYANTVDPGWVPTKMGGARAPDSLEKGFETQVWLAASNDPEARVSGHYFHQKRHAHYSQTANDIWCRRGYLRCLNR